MKYKKLSGIPSTIRIADPPLHLQNAFQTIFTKGALEFITQLVTAFEDDVEQLQWKRLRKKSEFYLKGELPSFPQSPARADLSWKIRPLPERLRNRELDLGDVSPANTNHFIKALNADVQGVQVDFDDGHCPTWHNQIVGLYNVHQAVRGELFGTQHIQNLPILMLRPRAWNMIEHNIIINGKETPGALLDFGILMYHNAEILAELNCGPFFYLSKLESASEAKLWNRIFVWAQQKLRLSVGTIKACVLIENIFAAFEMEEILYELRDHSLGLNCGIWDYTASIICKFGDSSNYVIPDRNKYVDADRHFLKKYMELVVTTCHSRGAPATGGMSALLVTPESHIEIKPFAPGNVTPDDLLQIPTGEVTLKGLEHNVTVAVLFIYNWLKGNGHFFYKGAVEDSATAEISRLQVWQWVRHQVSIEGTSAIVTKELLENIIKEFTRTQENNNLLNIANDLFVEIVTAKYSPDFITTYLNDHYIFKQIQKRNILKHKL
ncbi:hypothetical protein FQR65_LT09267 [Abscondita terminalis]|nr:hypothetical protein FQR65_LT09267 [Abscondita terminalis]